MNLDDVRPSFSVYVISSRPDELDHAGEALQGAGYLTSTFDGIDLAFTAVATNPPHVIVLGVDAGIDFAREIVDRVYAHLPETHVILIAPLGSRADFASMLDHGVYDIVWAPWGSATEVRRAVDRAVERDYFMYQNERLLATPAIEDPVATVVRFEAPPDLAPTPAPVREGAGFATALFARGTVDECVTTFLEHSAAGTGVFFKYLTHRRTLVAAVTVGLDPALTTGVGLNLNDAVEGFQNHQLREPARLPAVRHMIEEVFRTPTYFTRPLESGGEVTGIFVFPDQVDDDPGLTERLLLLDRAIGLLEAQRRLHVANTRDDATEVLSRVNFVERTVTEVSRARRLNLPVSMLAMAFDQYDLVGGEIGIPEAQLMLKTVAKLCEKYSRVHDVIGRIGTSELGLLLPHTSRRGALIKAERLRRALAQADFSKVVRTHARVTVSIGVSEYPTLVRDAEDLLGSAEETLFHVRHHGNRTAVAEAPADFKPDFAVRDLA